MRYIAENLMKKEFEVLGVVFSVEDMEELDLDIVFDKEDIDEDYGTLVWDCGGGYISGEKVVDIIRKTLIDEGFGIVEDMTHDELNHFVDNNYNMLYCYLV